MIVADRTDLAVAGSDLRKAFRRQGGAAVVALDGVSLQVRHGTLTALVGPDGAGKSTLIRLIAGLLRADEGELRVLDVDVAADPQSVQSRIGYMPQRFGLYEDLTVQENLDLYADLHGLSRDERAKQYPRLMAMTALGPFTNRLAGRLSGGMKQKLGLACTLVCSPELLLLDEPTVGVDPLSRRELWTIILRLVREEGLAALVSTSYLDEADRCDRAVVLHQGKVLTDTLPSDVRTLASGRTFMAAPPAGVVARSFQANLLHAPGVIDAVPEGGNVRLVLASREGGSESGENGTPGSAIGALTGAEVSPVESRFEDGFMVLLRQAVGHAPPAGPSESISPATGASKETIVEVHDLTRRFGDFTAVDRVTFDVRRGEVFGLLGPNGAGKTTTFRMLCGLLPVTSGTLRVVGVDLGHARAQARQRIGYVAQKFSLYGQLSVADNLDFFAAAYGLRGSRKRERIDWAIREFELGAFRRVSSGQLPGGYKQRLAMAAALLHEPEVLFLDEPTSGADPLARREFWRRITTLADRGVTVIVTTHFMEEAEYCDRLIIQDAGRVLAHGAPAEVRRLAPREPGREPTMEDAFVEVVRRSRENGTPSASGQGGGA